MRKKKKKKKIENILVNRLLQKETYEKRKIDKNVLLVTREGADIAATFKPTNISPMRAVAKRLAHPRASSVRLA